MDCLRPYKLPNTHFLSVCDSDTQRVIDLRSWQRKIGQKLRLFFYFKSKVILN